MINQAEDSLRAWEGHKFVVHGGDIRFGGRECEWAWGLDVEEGVLEDGSKTSKDYNFQREHDHVLVNDDCVPDGGDTRCCVVLLSCPSFYFSYF